MGTFSETAIVDYCLLSANQGKKKLPFSIFVCSKQKVCHFRFLFAASNWKLPFFVSAVFRI
jgi:hypothetical protein